MRVIIGDDELDRGEAQVKDLLASGEHQRVGLTLRTRLAKRWRRL